MLDGLFEAFVVFSIVYHILYFIKRYYRPSVCILDSAEYALPDSLAQSVAEIKGRFYPHCFPRRSQPIAGRAVIAHISRIGGVADGDFAAGIKVVHFLSPVMRRPWRGGYSKWMADWRSRIAPSMREVEVTGLRRKSVGLMVKSAAGNSISEAVSLRATARSASS